MDEWQVREIARQEMRRAQGGPDGPSLPPLSSIEEIVGASVIVGIAGLITGGLGHYLLGFILVSAAIISASLAVAWRECQSLCWEFFRGAGFFAIGMAGILVADIAIIYGYFCVLIATDKVVPESALLSVIFAIAGLASIVIFIGLFVKLTDYLYDLIF